MFGFGSRRRPDANLTRRGGAVGVALTATAVRAVQLPPGGKVKPIGLGESSDDLPLACRLGRPLQPGATDLLRSAPHQVCTNYLSQLGTPRQWQVGRAISTPEDALAATFAVVAQRLGGPETLALVLPPTLTAAQVKTVTRIAGDTGLILRAVASAPLATAAYNLDVDEDQGNSVIVVDCDDFALTATRLHHDGESVQQSAVAAFPALSVKLWGDRLIDGLADRCVRLCRRDPRDSATAEQALYDQIGPALDRARAGLGASLTVRHDHWVQDLSASPADWDALATPLAIEAARRLGEFATRSGTPRAVWLTPEAARLPGLLGRLTVLLPDAVTVSVLAANAVAEAAAALAARSPSVRPAALDSLSMDPAARPRPEARHLMGN